LKKLEFHLPERFSLRHPSLNREVIKLLHEFGGGAVVNLP
jgi:hypothetical protein